ncbi:MULTISPECIES: hypothetical protein [Haloarcula]|uniref:hypothetical protein n=1 Tax=Haloarcula TaxID=2237 RepID=UPI000F8E46B8|nr:MULTISPECIES: hypothetical protein [Haloarcula]NHX41413.1 hypothetical protein [Haloarcula sp. R1-2]
MSVEEREVEAAEESSTDRLRQFRLVNEHVEMLSELNGSTFRCKHLDEFGRSELYTLKSAGLVEDSGSSFGRVVDWELTDDCEDVLEAISVDEVDTPFLSEYVLDTVERHEDLLQELPESESTFQAADFELNASLLAALRRAGLIEREVQRNGSPDTWSVSDRTMRLRDFLGADE